jgi:methoxymalonate biosynthesis acyl carrier protein
MDGGVCDRPLFDLPSEFQGDLKTMHDHAVLERRIGEIFERELNLPALSPATDLFESGCLDSLSFVELWLQIELAFGLRIPLQDLELAEFRSIGRIAAFVRGRLATAAEPATERAFVEPPRPSQRGRPYREAQCPV